MANLTEFLNGLRTNAWRTSGARFNAARRLQKRDWFATFSIAMFSAIAIGIAVYQNIYRIDNPAVNNYLTTISVFISIFVIVISLIEWGLNGSVQREKLYDNAVKLNEFQRKLELELAKNSMPAARTVDALRKEYEVIKNLCPCNHLPIDDSMFLAEKRLSTEFQNNAGKPQMSWIEGKFVLVKFFLSDVWYFGIFWLVIIVLLNIVTSIALPVY